MAANATTEAPAPSIALEILAFLAPEKLQELADAAFQSLLFIAKQRDDLREARLAASEMIRSALRVRESTARIARADRLAAATLHAREEARRNAAAARSRTPAARPVASQDALPAARQTAPAASPPHAAERGGSEPHASSGNRPTPADLACEARRAGQQAIRAIAAIEAEHRAGVRHH